VLPGAIEPDKCVSWVALSFGGLPRSRPLALATFMPSLVLILMRSDSNSAIMAKTLSRSRPIGVVRVVDRSADVELSFTSAVVPVEVPLADVEPCADVPRRRLSC
jgi:hypothetical protein